MRRDLHVERDRLDQAAVVEHREHCGRVRAALVDAAQYPGDVVQVRRVSTLRQEHRLTAAGGDTRMVQVDVHHRVLGEQAVHVVLLEADQERPFAAAPGR